jgi:hypothetical protein
MGQVLETKRGPASSVWVAELRVSDKTAAKLASKHGLRACDVSIDQCLWFDSPSLASQ